MGSRDTQVTVDRKQIIGVSFIIIYFCYSRSYTGNNKEIPLRGFTDKKGRGFMKTPGTEVIKLEIWNEFVKHFRNEGTAAAYLSEIEEFERIAGKPFFASGAKETEKYYKWLKNREEQGEISGSTLGKKFWELHSFAAFAAERGGGYGVRTGFEDFFFPWLRAAGHQEKLVQSVPVEDMDALYQAAQEDSMAYTIISLIHRVGLSSREISELKPEDIVCYENGVFADIRNRDELCLIPADVVRILEQYLAEREMFEFLFYNRKGDPLNKMYISRLLKKYTVKAGIPSYSAEKIRTTCGVTMSAYGASAGQVAKQMGITGTQIRKYQNRQYKDNLRIKANELVKIRIEPPGIDKRF